MIHVSYGIYRDRFPLTGHTVNRVRSLLRDRWSIAAYVGQRLNGVEASDTDVLGENDVLVFVMPPGRKGMSDVEATALREVLIRISVSLEKIAEHVAKPEDEYLTARDAAKYLKISLGTFYNWSRHIPRMKTGRYTKTDLDRFARTRRKYPPHSDCPANLNRIPSISRP